MQKLKLIIALCLISTIGWAQGITVKGVVSDESGGLPGASVIVKGSEATGVVGTVTDIDGNYTLNVKANDVLLVAFLGYDTKEVPVAGQTVINITLDASAEALDELVVVGYGVQKKASSVGAISQAKGEQLLKAGSVTTVNEAIQGMLPGVTSIVTDGKPGAESSEIFIRGKASWQGSEPLILVDGVERDMSDVDPNEIEAISVLKDASATAVFGVKGGNGVILITTKRGQVSKAKISATANFGFKQPTSRLEFGDYDDAMALWNEAAMNDLQYSKLIPESTIAAWEQAFATGNTGPYNDYFPDIDWYDEIIKNWGYQQQYNINARGGTQFMKYFVSLGYLNDGDIYKTEENELFDPSFRYQRFNWRSNFDINVTPTTLFQVNIAGKLGYRNQPGYRINGDGETGWGQDQFFSKLYSSASNLFPIQWSNGTYGSDDTGGSNLGLAFDYGQRMYKYYDGFFDFKLDQKLDFITKGLSAKGSFSYSVSSKFESRIQRYEGGNFGESNAITFFRVYDYTQPIVAADGSISYPMISEKMYPDTENYQTPEPWAGYDFLMPSDDNPYSKRMYYEFSLNYARTFGDHSISALGLFSRREKKNNLTYEVERRQEDWVGRFTYAYKDRYLLEANGSRNGSEAFAPGKRFGTFYSGSVGWRISEEPFIKRNIGDVLSNLKVRYSYGTVGVDGDNRFLYQQAYSTSNTYSFGDYDSKTAYGPLYFEGDAANDNATWETSIKQNIGLEFGLMSKLTGTLELYDEKREGILMDIWAPIWYLPTNKTATGNIGETKNHGIELELGWSDNIGKEFRYFLRANLAANENRIVYRNDGVNTEEHLKQAGKPIGFQSKYINAGYYQDINDVFNYTGSSAYEGNWIPGDMIYLDYNNDRLIDSKDQVVTENLTYPLTTYGFSFGGSYKGFALNVRFYGVGNVNKDVPNLVLYDNLGGDGGVYSITTSASSSWTAATAATATKPVVHSESTANTYNRLASTYDYRDASYLRLKNVELSYNFNKSLVERWRMDKFQVYINGNNLYTWTNLQDGLDPESKNLTSYPMIRRFNLGFRASF